MTAKANKDQAEEPFDKLDSDQEKAKAALKEISKKETGKTASDATNLAKVASKKINGTVGEKHGKIVDERPAKPTDERPDEATEKRQNKAIGKRPDKATKLLKDAILKAAIKAGNQLGEDGLVSYLEAQALKNASSFLTLLGKVLPAELNNNGQEIKTVTKIELVAMKKPPKEKASRKEK